MNTAVRLFTGIALDRAPAGYAGGKEVPYTLEDRDRLIRVEAKVEAIEKRTRWR